MIYEPMLARVFEDVPTPMPCYVQPKLDGIRCIASYRAEDNTVIAQSRNGKALDLPEHISKTLLQFFTSSDCDKFILDGELYVHGLSFQEVMSRVKRVKSGRHPDVESVQYHIYDCISELSFERRHADLMHHLLRSDMRLNNGVTVVKTYLIKDDETLCACHRGFVKEGYEGSMIRNPNTPYECGKRSKSLLKRKDWLEDDFEIVDITEGLGKNAGTGVVTMKARNGKYFSATAPGDYTTKALWWTERGRFIGKKCSVKYQNLTDEGIPRFPEALGVKEDR